VILPPVWVMLGTFLPVLRVLPLAFLLLEVPVARRAFPSQRVGMSMLQVGRLSEEGAPGSCQCREN
jgi:hypothetical protein